MKINISNTIKITVAAIALSAGNYIHAQNTERNIIENYLAENKKTVGKTFEIIHKSQRRKEDGSVVNIQQTYRGVPVYGAISSVLLRNNTVRYLSDNFISTPEGLTSSQPTFDVRKNFSSILSARKLNGDTSDYTFEGRNTNTVVSKLVYFPNEEGELQLAYNINFFEKGTNNYWDIIVDANTGKTINKTNLTVSCQFHDHSFSAEHQLDELQTKKAITDFKAENVGKSKVDNASYRVYAFPVESPNFGTRTLEVNPWYDDASPLGWQNDGDDSYNITRGNNAYAYLDLNGSNAFGASANGGSQKLFDFPLDIAQPAGTYTDAAITNLFYASNKMHDIFYRYGFDEAGRNFQANNFGKGEPYTDYDPVLSEARDGASLNNANFATPQDGFSPRMQMYLWRYGYLLSYNAPGDMVGRRPAAGYNVDFGAAFPQNAPLTGDVAIATPADGCTNLTNTDLTGKIALIQRGTCNFDVKFKKAQDKGAKGVIIYNPSAGQSIINMSGTDGTVTIPGVLVDNTEGELIKSKIVAGTSVNVNFKYNTFDVDGSLDNGVIAHEYTHGISTRSTGNGYSCLNASYANEQMGEGWSDFFALMVTNKPDATPEQPRSTGSFVANQNSDGPGIRPAKYSPDFTVNDYTYGDTNGKYIDTGGGALAVDVHGIGFIWATMLWDLHWNFAAKYGFSNDIANDPDSGSGKVVKLVMLAMQIQGCYPNFVTGRDAILAADADLNNGENKCMIWKTFAKRGLGANASAGTTRGVLPNAISDQVEDFSLPAECSLGISDIVVNKKISIYPNPANKEVFIKTNGVQISGKVKVSIYDMSGKKVDEQLINADEPVMTSALPKGIYILTGDGIGINFSSKLIIDK
ncbi:T9SS-dependent M36 family metallopeptidase [Epilithonimonas mollis]|uniref:Por secretion system C-terminal sorting domain-containing protein n=1 Tax=Epilithonimonas mollis TaxID=216903 RepID=A0A1M6UV84_9FLAO|nr:T9SS-dependent M36 family metallopeptidase [Epilithonimonas mollis]SHK73104.1 Por secretion system C-terminal sorting domain-containing protein [Epilithonimonas mollis]